MSNVAISLRINIVLFAMNRFCALIVVKIFSQYLTCRRVHSVQSQVSSGWFHRSCGLEWPSGGAVDLGSCVICTEEMTRESSIEVPCCHQAFHVACLVRSFSSCELQCPLCNQSLAEFSRSASFFASSLFHGCMIDVDRSPSNRLMNSLVLPVGFPPRPETPVFLCCRRIGPPPQFEPSDDRQMEWSPSRVAHSSEWAAEWLCVGCSRTADLWHVPPSIPPPCPQCSNLPTMVVDVAAAQHWFWCSRCQRRLEACVDQPPIPQG